ncbi:hypothetical protein [uncultured Prevotella sp.]|uniref:hypothetical protein n=1 Tax=uncultured Prevotella sp. TaxID=159272 RepID=UPI0027E2E771|nr:hypothetical protein [uncultured Prevotella sp.]
MEEVKRGRAKKKLIRVTFPNGKEICYKSATDTMVATLQELGDDIISEIKMELCHLPLLSKEVYPKYKEWMKPVCDGWYINTQSNSDSKFLQLKAINEQLTLGLTIELGDDFEAQENPNKEKRSKSRDKLLVRFPNGQYFANNSTLDTFLEVVWEIGIDEIKRKELSWGGNPLVTSSKMFNNQVQVDEQRWIIVPNTTKDKIKLLRVIGAMFHLKMEITSI